MATAAGIPALILNGTSPATRSRPRSRASRAGTRFHPAGGARLELQALAQVREAHARPARGRRRRRAGAARARHEPAAGGRRRGRAATSRPATPSRCAPPTATRRSARGSSTTRPTSCARIKGLKSDAGARAAAAGDRGSRAPGLLRARVAAPVALRSPYDREILKLALPALGALAAEPLYLLADTAMVGHLGTPGAGRARDRRHAARRRASRSSTS